MATYSFRPRSYDNPLEWGSWSCIPDGACRYIPNNNKQGCVMTFETGFAHLQPSPNHGLVVKDHPKTRTMEEFLTKLQTEASQPSFPPPISQLHFPTPVRQQPPIQRFQIPISSPGHLDRAVLADNKPNKERGPTYYGHGHGGWDGPPRQQHQFIERSWSNNHNDEGDYRTQKAEPWTHDPRWLSMKPSPHDNRLSKPMNNIDEAIELFKGLVAIPQELPNTEAFVPIPQQQLPNNKEAFVAIPQQLPNKEAENKHSNSVNAAKQQTQSNNGLRGKPTNSITCKEAAEKYGGHIM